jgi:6-phosphogluconate dehydrogenase
MKDGLGMSHKEMGDVFEKWDKGVLDSYLIQITKEIVRSIREDLERH